MDLLQRNGYRLRAPEPEDLACMMLFENTTSLWTVSNTTGPYSRYWLKKYLEMTKNDLYEDRQLRLMIETPDKNVAGIIDLCNFDPFNQRAEVGVVIADNYQRKGIGELALQLLKEHAFGFLGIHQLYAYIDVTNGPCRYLFKKCGFSESACLKDWMKQGKAYRDVLMVQCINS